MSFQLIGMKSFNAGLFKEHYFVKFMGSKALLIGNNQS